MRAAEGASSWMGLNGLEQSGRGGPESGQTAYRAET